MNEKDYAKKCKKPNIPIAVEREVARLRKRVEELERVGKLAHDTIADLVGVIGPSHPVTLQVDEKCFRELVRVLFIDK